MSRFEFTGVEKPKLLVQNCCGVRLGRVQTLLIRDIHPFCSRDLNISEILRWRVCAPAREASPDS